MNDPPFRASCAFAAFAFEPEPFGPARSIATVAYSWQGTTVESVSGTPWDEGRQDHACLAVKLLQLPLSMPPLRGASAWGTVQTCVRLCLPGEERDFAGESLAQTSFVFIARERIEGIVEKPRPRIHCGVRHGLDLRSLFVSGVIAALSDDVAARGVAGSSLGASVGRVPVAHWEICLRGVPAVESHAVPSPLAFGRVLEYIDANLARPLRMAELARQADCSQRQLSRAFRERKGVLPQRYVLARRVERARSLMETGQFTLARVARAVGFADQSQMTKIFRRLVGTTPGRLNARGTRLPPRASRGEVCPGAKADQARSS